MATSQILWPCELRTKAKLAILKRYLGAWFSILAAKGHRNVTYLDGFCGPGKYSTGEEGSPVIACRYASAAAQQYPHFHAQIICVDEDEAALEHLQALVPIKKPHPNVNVIFRHGTFETQVKGIFDDLAIPQQWPTFCFIDPFGFGETPYEMMAPLVRSQSSELFINFMCGFMNRFKEHPDEQVRERIRRMVGTDYLERILSSADPISELCNIYEENLHRLGKYVKKFMMRDEGNVRDNALFFCGNNRRGFEKIKEAVWLLDPIHGGSFSAYQARREEDTLPLEGISTPQVRPLRQEIERLYESRQDVAVSELERWTIDETENFLPRHLKMILGEMESENRISIHDPQPGNRPRRRGQFPSRLKISFRKSNG